MPKSKPSRPRTKSARATRERLAKLAAGVAADAKKKRNPSVSIPVRALSNVRFNEAKRIIELG